MVKNLNINFIYGKMLRVIFFGWHKMQVQQRRKRMKLFNGLTLIDRDVVVEELNQLEIPAKRITNQPTTQGTILYLHGGAYVLGMTNNHINLCGKIARKTNKKIIAPHYGLAPENPFPCALQDVVSIYYELINQESEFHPFFIGGDSAGGGLALALLQVIREKDYPMPDGVFLFSPWTDLTLSGNSVREMAKVDPILSWKGLQEDAYAYADNHDLNSPLISPLFASTTGFPPILIQVGTHEILLDDARSFAMQARSQGVDVVLSEWEGLFHVFQMFPLLQAADEAINEVAAFISQHNKFSS
jgi:epsilon-lactone hydrolase